MSDDLKKLYQEIILKHNKAPSGKEAAPDTWLKAEGRNSTCGDEVKLALDIESEHVKAARFEGAGCAICTASASMLVEAVKNQPLGDVSALRDQVDRALKGGALLDAEKHGDLHALNGVHSFPARLRCASLAWDVLGIALETHKKSHHHE